MEAKCSFCELFGEKSHCHNCKIFNNARARAPQEIDCSLEEFVEYIESHDDISERFGFGDYKNIELYTGEVVKMVILDTGRDQLEAGGYAKVTLGILGMDGLFQMNDTDTNSGGWRDSKMRTIRMPRIFKLLPPILQEHIKPVVKHTGVGNRVNELAETVDKLFLFSEVEVYGRLDYSMPGEDHQYDYFKFDANRNFDRYTWLRSPYSGNSNSFCCISSSGSAYYIGASYSNGVAFGFCL